jgi:hypothetical protein
MPNIVVPLVDPSIDPNTHPTTVVITPREQIKRPNKAARNRMLIAANSYRLFRPGTRPTNDEREKGRGSIDRGAPAIHNTLCDKQD